MHSHNFSKFKNVLAHYIEHMKEFDQDKIKISAIPFMILKTCEKIKYYPLGENFMKLIFDPKPNMLIKYDEQFRVSKKWINEDLIKYGIVSDVLNTNGFRNLHLTCVLQFMLKTLTK